MLYKRPLFQIVLFICALSMGGEAMGQQGMEPPRIPQIHFDNRGELILRPSPTSSKHDFDFMDGPHTVRHRKLKHRLAQNDEWIEFAGTQSQEFFIDGLGNIERHQMVDNAGVPVEGAAIRLFDPKTRLWSIYWADSRTAKFDPPVVGSFEDGVAFFFGKDVFKGKEIIVAFCWDGRDVDRPVWSQAFSDDRGKSWEWNWFMYFSKQGE